ncbi:MAG: molybdopterin biosynthesis protein [Planctomycetales bacterium]|nr:molybdopterin biosynthesis protein [Planctomycetales bacterium]
MQDQFLDVIDRDEAERRFHAALQLTPLGSETIPLAAALGRTLAADARAAVDVPSFDRSNVDGYAVQAADTFGATEERPVALRLLPETIATAVEPTCVVGPGEAVEIATGGMMPRGADAVVMVEHADEELVDANDDSGRQLVVRRAVTAGAHVAYAGTDIAAGETVVRRGETLTSRETGVLAAIGVIEVAVWRRPRVGILSTGDEIIAPGMPMRAGLVYDSNARVLADAALELGGEPIELGIVHDNLEQLRERTLAALATCDIVLLSGGTSKGAGDLSYRVVREFSDPGIVAHGVALKPGKPICLAVTRGKPLVILPGFPTSAIFTFHEFVAPVIRRLAGLPPLDRQRVPARLAVKVNSEIGRTEYLLVGLVERAEAAADEEAADSTLTGVSAELPAATSPRLAAYPMGKGSGSVTAFSRADGFVTIGRQHEIVEAGARVEVQLLGRELRVADLVVIGSHCVGLDYLLGRLQDQGFHTKFLAVGSTAGLEAVRRGECDLAGVHLLDERSGEYNRPFLSDKMQLIPGYGRLQGVVFRRDDVRFAGHSARSAVAAVKDMPGCLMVNRNQGSGTRILIDQLLAGARPAGYSHQSRSHNAVAAAVAQGRADWGVAIRTVADQANLGFLPLTAEQYDFVHPTARANRPALLAFRQLLTTPETREALAERGFGIMASVETPNG